MADLKVSLSQEMYSGSAWCSEMEQHSEFSFHCGGVVCCGSTDRKW